MKKLYCALIAFVVCSLLFSGCGNTVNQKDFVSDDPTLNSEPMFDLDEYKLLVSVCRTAINDASIYVANTGTYEYNYWKALGKLSDSMTDSAFEWLSENSDATRETVDADYELIRQQYKDIILTEIEGKEAEEIDAAFRSMYDAYSSMYSLVTSPSGSLSDFASSLNEYINAITSSDESLSLFLD